MTQPGTRPRPSLSKDEGRAPRNKVDDGDACTCLAAYDFAAS